MNASGWPVDPGERPEARYGAWSPPPVPPMAPAPHTAPQPQVPRGSKRWGRGAAVAGTAAILMAGVAFGAGRLTADAGPTSSEALTAAGAPVAAGGPVLSSQGEPVAAVAKALSPAVVQIETGSGLGSGFIYDKSGLIMTAAHVTGESQEVTVRLADGRSLQGKVLGADKASDVAVIKVEGDNLPVATLATGSTPQVGQMAVAIGSPFGLDQTVTAGIVSAVGRSVETPGGALPMIQTDAPINPGNSGGALADRQGRVIGINDSIASNGGGNEGVGFAVPIDTALSVAKSLASGQTVQTGFLGVSSSDPEAGSQAGALIVEVEDGSPAARAGIEKGDLVTEVNGAAVDNSTDLVAAIRSRAPGDSVQLTIVRSGQSSTVSVTLGQSGN